MRAGGWVSRTGRAVLPRPVPTSPPEPSAAVCGGTLLAGQTLHHHPPPPNLPSDLGRMNPEHAFRLFDT